MVKIKSYVLVPAIIASLGLMSACSVNPATGEQQFTALMPAAQEAAIGAQEHEKVIKTYGAPRADDPLQKYVESVGAKVAAHTERPDVTYKFFLLDTPMMNAFALPGGYVYVTRGILAQANSEAELAAVLAHEVGHITARHAAERYSHGALASLGTLVIAAATDSAQVVRAAELGSDLYIKSYSRRQESQSDELGIRYLTRAGYNPEAMAGFLEALAAHDDLESEIAGQQKDNSLNYFATHPRTEDRSAQAMQIAAQYKGEGGDNRNEYLNKIDGMTYGDSADQGFVREQEFWHPGMGFTFNVPQGFVVNNEPSQIVAASPRTGAVVIFDSAGNKGIADPAAYIARSWMKNELLADPEAIDINGLRAATASFDGSINNRPSTIRVVAVSWDDKRMFRFQMAIPRGTDSTTIEDLKLMTYSLRPMSTREKETVRPYRIDVVTAKPGDTVDSMAARMPYKEYAVARFQALNNLRQDEVIQSGKRYKLIKG